MKISTTQEGLVTFSGMNANLAEALIDLANDLVQDNAVLLYGPGYVPLAKPTIRLKEELDRLLSADVRLLGGTAREHRDDDWFETIPLLEEDHIKVWGEAFPADPDRSSE